MATFDLDTHVEETEGDARPRITSKFMCTPGCPTGGLACFTSQCTMVVASPVEASISNLVVASCVPRGKPCL